MNDRDKERLADLCLTIVLLAAVFIPLILLWVSKPTGGRALFFVGFLLLYLRPKYGGRQKQ